MAEAKLTKAESGLVPDGEGWFIVNVAEAEGIHTEQFGDGVRFEGKALFPGFGINIRLLQPGQPNAMYHREAAAEAFVVLSGECVAVIDDEERPLRKGDFLYTPPGVAHVIVGAGDGPASVLMVGARVSDFEIVFPVSEAAAKYGASVEEETSDASEAYKGASGLDSASIGLGW